MPLLLRIVFFAFIALQTPFLFGEEIVSLRTSDGVRIAGSLFYPAGYKPGDTNCKYPAVLLLHMWNTDRREWAPLIPSLVNANYVVLSIDFRGHGESGGKRNLNFPKSTAGSMILDAVAAYDFISSMDIVDAENLSVVGASIGSTVGIQLYKHTSSNGRSNLRSLVLISPACSYFGVAVDQSIIKRGNTAMLFVFEKNDPAADDNRNYVSGNKLYELFKGEKKEITYTGAGHGIKMLAQRELVPQILEWIDRHSYEKRKITVERAKADYCLALLTGEGESYAPAFYDDYVLMVDTMPVVQFTKLLGEPVDFYFYATGREDLCFLSRLFERRRGVLDAVSPRIYPAFLRYMSTRPSYGKDGLHYNAGKVIETTRHVSVEKLIDKISKAEIDSVMYQYLVSNGINSLDEITAFPGFTSMLVNKFYMLSTTCFYRERARLKTLNSYFKPLRENIEREDRPFKAKVYACSTGEEVLTYAVELLEAGIEDFTILASDVNNSSLDYAREMKYSYSSIAMLPFELQAKLKKYFRLNGETNLWEPKNADFFRARIKYINHDILEPLPPDLEEKFAPPYDLVSILNVLLYLEDSTVQANRKYWLDIIGPGGILVLRDSKYSIALKKLGGRWGYDNFMIANDCINIRPEKELSAKQKLAIYRQQFADDDSEHNLLSLCQACEAANLPAEAARSCEEYLKKHPASVTAMNLLLEYYNKHLDLPGREKLVRGIIHNLSMNYISHENMLENLMLVETDKRMMPYWKKLKRDYSVFISTFGSAPIAAEVVFDYDVPPGPITFARLLIKSSALVYLQEYYASAKMNDEAERVSLKGLDTVDELFRSSCTYSIAGRFVGQFADWLIQYYEDTGSPDKVIAVSNRCIQMLDKYLPENDSMYVLQCLGELYLEKAIACDAQGNRKEFADSIGKAIPYCTAALPHFDNINLYPLSLLYGKTGHAHLLRGINRISEGERELAENDLRQALSYFEKGLEITPVYGRYIVDKRNRLVETARKNNLLKGVIPEENE